MTKRFWADSALLAVAFAWGTTFTIVKDAVAAVPVYYFLAVRFIIAVAILITIFRRRLRLISLQTLLKGLLVGFFLFAGYVLQTIGLQYTTPSKAGFITGLSVVIVPLLSPFLIKKAPGWGAGIGAVIAAVGLGLLSLDRSLTLAHGDTLVLLSALAFALHIIAVGRFTTDSDPIQLTIVQIAFVGSACAVISWFTENPAHVVMTDFVWFAVIITSVFATAAAFLIQNMVQQFTTPTRTALIFTMEPVFAALFSVTVGYEILPANAVWGCLLILTGMLLSEFKISDLLKVLKLKAR